MNSVDKFPRPSEELRLAGGLRRRHVSVVFDEGLERVRGETTQPQILDWRGHGGRHPTISSVEFDRQLDKVAMWLENWTHDQRCHVMEGLIQRSNFNQFQFLATTLQPMLHRDFMYTAQSQFPEQDFQPLSTHTSRRLKEKLAYTRQDNFHRVKSAYYHTDDDVRELARRQQVKYRDHVRFPDITAISGEPTFNRQISEITSFVAGSSSLPKLAPDGNWKNVHKVQRYASRFQGDGINPIFASVPYLRYVEMPMRRHIQDEVLSPRTLSGCHVPDAVLSPRTLSGSQSDRSAITNRIGSLNSAKSNPEPNIKSLSSKKIKEIFKLNTGISEMPGEARQLFNWYSDQWSDVKRNEFLHKFLLKLDPRQHFFVSNFLAVRSHRDFLALLPEKIALKILSYLAVRELLIAANVSKTWQRLCNSNELWKAKCMAVKLEVEIAENPIWKTVFKDNMYLRLNWNQGRCQTTALKGHTNNVVCVAFDKKRLASGSVDRTIRIWDIKSGTLISTLKGHAKGVWCLDFFTKNLLISGGYDGTVRLWNLRTGICAKTILAHDGPMWAMKRRDNTLATVSQDRTIKIWDIGRCLLQTTLFGHNSAVFAIDMDEEGKLVISGSADKSVKIWSLETGKCKRTFWVSPTTSVMAVSYSRGYFACSYGETICLYKAEGPKTPLRTYREHSKRVETLELRISNPAVPEGLIISAGKDGKIIYWDITKDKSIHTFVGHHGEPVNAIHFDELRIASASHDYTIKVWDFSI